jgi:hypothetical protein
MKEIITLTLHFFLGKPQHIEGWLVPFHRHPEWDVAHLRQVMAQAQSLSQAERSRRFSIFLRADTRQEL